MEKSQLIDLFFKRSLLFDEEFMKADKPTQISTTEYIFDNYLTNNDQIYFCTNNCKSFREFIKKKINDLFGGVHAAPRKYNSRSFMSSLGIYKR
jgi:hypothetical protein